MSAAEFGAYLARAIREFAQDKVDSGQWSSDAALELSRQGFEESLPQGIASPDHFLFTVRDAVTQVAVGVLWFGVQERAGPPIAYLFDVLVERPYRRMGYGTRTLAALQIEVEPRGLGGIGLHVFGHNAAARARYEKIGYHVTNINMFKQVARARI